MNRLVVAFCGLIALGATAALAETPWQEYVYADDGFAISAPAEPSQEQFPIYVVGGTANAHVYSIAASGDSEFMVYIFKRHPDDKRSEVQFHEHAQQGAVGAVKGKLHAKSELALGNYRGAEMEFESQHGEADRKNHHVRSRYYLVGRLVYHLMAVAPVGQPLPADTNRWFASFRLIKTADQ
jgi:hypothetical protein